MLRRSVSVRLALLLLLLVVVSMFLGSDPWGPA
jgi:hypothetical protein